MTRLQVHARCVTSGVRRLRGQVDPIERTLGGGASCLDLLQRSTGGRGAINVRMAEVLEEQVREYLSPADVDADPLKADAAEELTDIIHSYLTSGFIFPSGSAKKIPSLGSSRPHYRGACVNTLGFGQDRKSVV